MSHFYRQKSYSFYETDELLKEVKNEMSNFLTKEEAELILNKRYAMIDPNPNQEQKNHMIILHQFVEMRNYLQMVITI